MSDSIKNHQRGNKMDSKQKILTETEHKKFDKELQKQIGYLLCKDESINVWRSLSSQGKVRFNFKTDMMTKFSLNLIQKLTDSEFKAVDIIENKVCVIFEIKGETK